MQYQIKRKTSGADLIVSTITPTGSQQREAMGVDVVDMAFALPNYVEFKLGDFVDVYGQTYKLNSLPSVQKVSRRHYSYNLQFEAVFYDLAKVQMQMLNAQNQLLEPVFDLTGNAATVVALIVENALRYSAGWSVGVVDETDYQTFTFNARNCLQALHELASRFNTEFWIDNKTIHLQRREQSSGLTFEYGQGKGLYTVTRKAKDGAKLLTRLYVRGGSTNLPSGYGSNSLLLPNGETYIQDDAKVDPAQGGELIEATQVFSDIFPTRTGTISSVVAGDDNWKYFFDTALDFDINEHKAAGLEVKVHFLDGDLAGYTFTVAEYNHATKRFIINKNEEETTLEMPSNSLRPRIGNKYRLIDLVLPQSYVDDAENRLLAAAQDYYDQNSNVANLNEYSATVDRMFVKNNAIDVVLGNTAILQDGDMNFTTELRISKYTRNLQDAYDYPEVVWSDKISANEIIRQYQQQKQTLLLLESSGLLSVDQMRKNLFLNRLSANGGYLYLGADKIKAGTADYAAQAGHALLASEAINADLWDARQFDDYLNQAVKTNSDVTFKSVVSPNFVSGALGSGFRINQNGDAEFDNLVVRKSFNVTEFVLQKVRATNGAIAVTDSIVVKAVEALGGYYFKCFIDTDGGKIVNSFMIDDFIRSQVFTGNSSKYIFGHVVDLGADYFTIYLDNATVHPTAGDTFIRVGSITDLDRQGLIYMTNGDSGAPFIDVLDGVNSESFDGKIKVRLGKLDGIVDAELGALSGYGIYAQNGYFKGKIYVTGGNAQTIAGAQTQANLAQANAVAAAASDASAKQLAAEANAQAMVDAVKVGGRNLIKSSRQTISGVGKLQTYWLSSALKIGETYTATLNGISGIGAGFRMWVSYENQAAVILTKTDGIDTASTSFIYNGEADELRVTVYSEQSINPSTVHWVKIESGNKATDWTPAPEDVQAAVDAAQSTATAAQAANAALSASLKAMAFEDIVELSKLGNTVIEGGKIKTNLLDADYIKANIINTAYINALEIDASAIKTGQIDSDRINADQIIVAGGGATQAYAQGLVNSVKIGAKNLVLDSKKTVLVPALLILNLSEPLVVGETYTATICGMRGDGAALSLYADAGYQIIVSFGSLTGMHTLSATFVYNGTHGEHSSVRIYNEHSANASTFYWVKVEKGNKATDWTPAPEDLTESIQVAKNLAIATASADATAKQLAAEANAQAMVDAVKVGGRNLLLNYKGAPTGWSEAYNDVQKGEVVKTVSNPTYWYNKFARRLEHGEVVTFSIMCRTLSGSIPIVAYFNGVNSYQQVGVANENWQLLSMTRTIYNGVELSDVLHISGGDFTDGLIYEYVKLEVGTKGTDGSPAPEDVQAAVDAAKSAATAAQAANAALTASLKAMAYKDVVELAELGTTVIQGGKIKTTLLDADYIKANIVNASYINSLEIITNNLKTAPNGKRVEIDSEENNIRLLDVDNNELICIDDDASFEYYRIRPIDGGGTQIIEVYGPGVRVGKTTGKSSNLSRYGFSLKGDDSQEKFKMGFGSNDQGMIKATGFDPDPTSYYHDEQVAFLGLDGVFDLRKADGNTVKVAFCNGLLMRVGNPTTLLYWNNVVGSATVTFAPCATGEVGTTHTKTVPIGTVKGTSQTDANNKAQAQALALAQADAAANGYCQLGKYRIIFAKDSHEVTYEVRGVDNNLVALPTNVNVSYSFATTSGWDVGSKTLSSGLSSGGVFIRLDVILDFYVDSYNPTSFGGRDIEVEYL